MAIEIENQVVDLWTELKQAYDRAVQRFPDRIEDIDTVFAVTDALRRSLCELDAIGTQETAVSQYCVRQVDDLHAALWNNRELFDSISDRSRGLFTWRENSIQWHGNTDSNIVEVIRNVALQYSEILQLCSLHNTLAPSQQRRDVYPEPWFNPVGVQEVSRRIRERISVSDATKDKSKKRSTDKPDASWTAEAETEGRRILEANQGMSSNDFVRKVGGNRTVAQSLYRYIAKKEKRRTQTD